MKNDKWMKFGKLVRDGYDKERIKQVLGISERTYYRYEASYKEMAKNFFTWLERTGFPGKYAEKYAWIRNNERIYSKILTKEEREQIRLSKNSLENHD